MNTTAQPLPETAAPRARPAVRAVLQETLADRLNRWRYTYWPDHMLGELLAKRWMETAIPVIVLLLVAFALSRALPNFFSASNLADSGRQAGEIGFIVLGMALVMIVGGIDLSVGSMFALTNFCALYCMHVLKWPVPAAVALTLVFGALLGAVNGVLIGYFRLRAFLTTLITLIVYRALYDILTADYSTAIAGGLPDSAVWDFVGSGAWFGVPTVVWFYAAVAIFGHVFITRLRAGWHITAIGGSRRSAYNTGIAVRATVARCYVASGVLTAMGGIFFASRLATAGGDIGVGLEVTVLTAAVLGGISLGGGKGSVMKALVGTLIVLLIINGLTSMGLQGGYNRMVLAGILLLAAVVDIRWLKNKHRIVNKVYVSPTYHGMPPAPSCDPQAGTEWALNDRLHGRPGRLAWVASKARKTSSWTATTTSTPARDTATSSASSRPTTSRWKSSRTSAARRWAWPSTARTTCTCASAAWGCTWSRPSAWCTRSPTKHSATTSPSTTTAGCAWPTTWT